MIFTNPRGNLGRKSGATRRLLSMTALSATIGFGLVGQIAAPAFAQVVTKHFAVNLGPASVEDALKYLQRETGVRVIFSPVQVRERKTQGL